MNAILKSLMLFSLIFTLETTSSPIEEHYHFLQTNPSKAYDGSIRVRNNLQHDVLLPNILFEKLYNSYKGIQSYIGAYEKSCLQERPAELTLQSTIFIKALSNFILYLDNNSSHENGLLKVEVNGHVLKVFIESVEEYLERRKDRYVKDFHILFRDDDIALLIDLSELIEILSFNASSIESNNHYSSSEKHAKLYQNLALLKRSSQLDFKEALCVPHSQEDSKAPSLIPNSIEAYFYEGGKKISVLGKEYPAQENIFLSLKAVESETKITQASINYVIEDSDQKETLYFSILKEKNKSYYDLITTYPFPHKYKNKNVYLKEVVLVDLAGNRSVHTIKGRGKHLLKIIPSSEGDDYTPPNIDIKSIRVYTKNDDGTKTELTKNKQGQYVTNEIQDIFYSIDVSDLEDNIKLQILRSSEEGGLPTLKRLWKNSDQIYEGRVDIYKNTHKREYFIHEVTATDPHGNQKKVIFPNDNLLHLFSFVTGNTNDTVKPEVDEKSLRVFRRVHDIQNEHDLPFEKNKRHAFPGETIYFSFAAYDEGNGPLNGQLKHRSVSKGHRDIATLKLNPYDPLDNQEYTHLIGSIKVPEISSSRSFHIEEIEIRDLAGNTTTHKPETPIYLFDVQTPERDHSDSPFQRKTYRLSYSQNGAPEESKYIKQRFEELNSTNYSKREGSTHVLRLLKQHKLLKTVPSGLSKDAKYRWEHWID